MVRNRGFGRGLTEYPKRARGLSIVINQVEVERLKIYVVMTVPYNNFDDKKNNSAWNGSKMNHFSVSLSIRVNEDEESFVNRSKDRVVG